MAINFTVSYSFSPNTTISSSQVNTNFSDEANVWVGLEGLTKTFAKLKVDVDPTTALEVATKQYVDHYSTWRRPVLKYASATTVTVESGLDGTSGDIPILFPDGTIRTETSATRTTFDITRNAVLTTSGAQSGLTGATTEGTNSWYALYAVKVTDSSTQWVTIGTTVLPIQANYATLNTAYQASGWVYLGLIRNGDNSGTTGDILPFSQAGNITLFTNTATAQTISMRGTRLASTASAATLTYTYSAGTGTTAIPNNITHVYYGTDASTGSVKGAIVQNAAGAIYFDERWSSGQTVTHTWAVASDGVKMSNSAAENEAMAIMLCGFVDGALGVGSNPIL